MPLGQNNEIIPALILRNKDVDKCASIVKFKIRKAAANATTDVGVVNEYDYTDLTQAQASKAVIGADWEIEQEVAKANKLTFTLVTPFFSDYWLETYDQVTVVVINGTTEKILFKGYVDIAVEDEENPRIPVKTFNITCLGPEQRFFETPVIHTWHDMTTKEILLDVWKRWLQGDKNGFPEPWFSESSQWEQKVPKIQHEDAIDRLLETLVLDNGGLWYVNADGVCKFWMKDDIENKLQYIPTEEDIEGIRSPLTIELNNDTYANQVKFKARNVAGDTKTVELPKISTDGTINVPFKVNGITSLTIDGQEYKKVDSIENCDPSIPGGKPQLPADSPDKDKPQPEPVKQFSFSVEGDKTVITVCPNPNAVAPQTSQDANGGGAGTDVDGSGNVVGQGGQSGMDAPQGLDFLGMNVQYVPKDVPGYHEGVDNQHQYIIAYEDFYTGQLFQMHHFAHFIQGTPPDKQHFNIQVMKDAGMHLQIYEDIDPQNITGQHHYNGNVKEEYWQVYSAVAWPGQDIPVSVIRMNKWNGFTVFSIPIGYHDIKDDVRDKARLKLVNMVGDAVLWKLNKPLYKTIFEDIAKRANDNERNKDVQWALLAAKYMQLRPEAEKNGVGTQWTNDLFAHWRDCEPPKAPTERAKEDLAIYQFADKYFHSIGDWIHKQGVGFWSSIGSFDSRSTTQPKPSGDELKGRFESAWENQWDNLMNVGDRIRFYAWIDSSAVPERAQFRQYINNMVENDHWDADDLLRTIAPLLPDKDSADPNILGHCGKEIGLRKMSIWNQIMSSDKLTWPEKVRLARELRSLDEKGLQDFINKLNGKLEASQQKQDATNNPGGAGSEGVTHGGSLTYTEDISAVIVLNEMSEQARLRSKMDLGFVISKDITTDTIRTLDEVKRYMRAYLKECIKIEHTANLSLYRGDAVCSLADVEFQPWAVDFSKLKYVIGVDSCVSENTHTPQPGEEATATASGQQIKGDPGIGLPGTPVLDNTDPIIPTDATATPIDNSIQIPTPDLPGSEFVNGNDNLHNRLETNYVKYANYYKTIFTLKHRKIKQEFVATNDEVNKNHTSAINTNEVLVSNPIGWGDIKYGSLGFEFELDDGMMHSWERYFKRDKYATLEEDVEEKDMEEIGDLDDATLNITFDIVAENTKVDQSDYTVDDAPGMKKDETFNPIAQPKLERIR